MSTGVLTQGCKGGVDGENEKGEKTPGVAWGGEEHVLKISGVPKKTFCLGGAQGGGQSQKKKKKKKPT